MQKRPEKLYNFVLFMLTLQKTNGIMLQYAAQ